jgi:hypothetical protein
LAAGGAFWCAEALARVLASKSNSQVKSKGTTGKAATACFDFAQFESDSGLIREPIVNFFVEVSKIEHRPRIATRHGRSITAPVTAPTGD